MTSRRNLFKLACCAVAASAMEVMGWEGVNTELAPNDLYASAEYEEILFYGPHFSPTPGWINTAHSVPSGRRYHFVDGKYVEAPRPT